MEIILPYIHYAICLIQACIGLFGYYRLRNQGDGPTVKFRKQYLYIIGIAVISAISFFAKINPIAYFTQGVLIGLASFMLKRIPSASHARLDFGHVGIMALSIGSIIAQYL